MNLALVFHNHQPVGQLPWAFEDAADNCYTPFLQTLARHPKIPVALHFSGPLLDWLCQNRPETIEQVREIVARGQAEILGGGYYEPILAIWPAADQKAQIELLAARVAELFDVAPTGLWLAERVYEPQLAPLLAGCGVSHTFIDSAVFETGGIAETKQFGYYSAPGGLKLFPINTQLRYLVPWAETEDAIAYLKQQHKARGADALAVFADDGEKFGGWPGTYDLIYTNGWLDKFFTLLEKNKRWLKLITPAQYAIAHPPLGTVDLPAGSYTEMQGWSGGNWRNFLVKYEESRDMYNEVKRAAELVDEQSGMVPDEALDEAYRAVLRAQCNDAYWHGTFGGLYLRHLRQAIYAETATVHELLGTAGHEVSVSRHKAISNDGKAYLESDNIELGAKANGGRLFLLSSKIAHHNLLSTLRRHAESYLPEGTPIDWYARGACVDHFFGPAATPDSFAAADFGELGDFASEAWSIVARAKDDAGSIALNRSGHVWCEGEHVPIDIEKRLSLIGGSETIDVEYAFTNRSDVPRQLWWGTEWNAAVTGVAMPDRHYHSAPGGESLRLDAIDSFDAVTNPIVADRWLQLWFEWQFDAPMAMWHVPIFTVSQKEGGETERTHQSSAFVFHRRLSLAPGDPFRLRFKTILTAKVSERP